MKKIRLKAIIFGTLVDIGGSITTALFVSVASAFGYLMSRGSADSLMDMFHSPAFLVSSLVLGFAGTFFGGFTAGKFADRYELPHSAVIGVIAILLGLPFLGSVNTPWFDITGIAGSIPAALLGGFFALRSNRRGGKKTRAVVSTRV